MNSLIPVLRCKPGCAFDRIAPGGFRILAALDAAAKIVGVDLELTAGTNDHTTGKHVSGEAYDVSVTGMTVPQVLKTKRFLEQALGLRFTVLYEVAIQPADPALVAVAFVNPDASGPHLHVQIAKGTVYPPLEMLI